MAFTIYTVSDPATIGSALTSRAMFFGQDSWVGSALKTALLISLIAILFKGVTRDGLRLDVMLIQLLLVTMAFLPKTTVTVEQFDNSAPPRVIDDVPYAIAIPGSIAGAFALYMTQKIETVMASVNGDYISVTGDKSPFTPARMLMSFTACATDPMSCLDRNLVETMALAARYCGGSKLQGTNFSTVQSVLGEFAKGLTEPGLTVIYDESNPYQSGGNSGRAASCSEAAAHITSVAADLAANNPGVFKTILETKTNNADIKRYSAQAQADTGEMKEWSQRLAEINMVTDSSRKIDTLAVANVMTISIAESLKYDATGAIDTAINMRRDLGLFEWAKTEAQQSMLVSSTAPKFMDVLFFIFIAATPIVMFVVAANPASGLKVAGSYALFGVWTQSWIPMMAIVMSWYQTEMMNFPAPSEFGHSAEYMAALMRHVNTSTIAAGNMIQNAPYMMFAIMTGSMFALSNMISKAVPSGGGGEGASAGDSGGTGKSKTLGAIESATAGPTGVQQRAAIEGAVSALAHGAMNPAAFKGSGNIDAAVGSGTLGEFSSSGAVNAASQAATAKAAEKSQQVATASSKALGEIFSMAQAGTMGITSAQLASVMQSSGYRVANDFGVTRKNDATDAVNAEKGTQSSNKLNFGGAVHAGISTGTLAKAAEAIAKGAQDKALNAAEKGILGNIQDLARKAAAADASGNPGAASAAAQALSNAMTGYDAMFPKADGGLTGKLTGFLATAAKALDIGAQARAGAEQTNTQNAAATHKRGGSRTDSATGGESVSAFGGRVKNTSATGQTSNGYTETAQKLKSLTDTVTETAQEALAAKQTATATQSAASSSGVGSSTPIKGAAIAQAWGDRQPTTATNARDAIGQVTAALGPSLGNFSGQFQKALEANYASIASSANGASTMNPTQIAAAAAVKALHAMTQSGGDDQKAAAYMAAGEMARQGGMGDVLNTQPLKEAAKTGAAANKEIAETEGSLKKPMDALLNKAAQLDPDETKAFVQDVLQGIQDNKGAAVSGYNAAQGAADPKMQGIAMGQALLNTPEVQAIIAERDPAKAAARAREFAENQNIAPSQADNHSYLSGQPNREGVKQFAEDLIMGLREKFGGHDSQGGQGSGGGMLDGVLRTGESTAKEVTEGGGGGGGGGQGGGGGGQGVPAPSPANVADGASSPSVQTTQPVATETVVSAPQGGGGAAPATPSATGGALPTTGEPIRFGGASANGGGGGNGGATPDEQGGQPMGSKPNSRVPSEGNGPGKKSSIPGRN